MFGLDAERAHEIAIRVLRLGLAAPFYVDDPSFGFRPIDLFGLKFTNLLGVAAGFDKNGIVVNQLASLGFGFVEVGTVTFRPQAGNPKPRLFRLPDDQALINRLGFNNDGAEAVAKRLANLERKCVIGVNIGRNKDVSNDDAVSNYLACFDIVHPVADYVAVNVSSPNTPGLRELQRHDNLEELLAVLQDRNTQLKRKPLLVKIAPDLDLDEIRSITDMCIKYEIDGIIATNTTVARTDLKSKHADEIGQGGLSGRPLFGRSNEIVTAIHEHTAGELPIVGVGGVFGAGDAFAKIQAGASLVQAYTGFIYGGPRFAAATNRLLTVMAEATGLLAKR